MLIFDVSVECRIAEITFTTNADVVPFHGIITGSTFSSGYELVTLNVGLLLSGDHIEYKLNISKL